MARRRWREGYDGAAKGLFAELKIELGKECVRNGHQFTETQTEEKRILGSIVVLDESRHFGKEEPSHTNQHPIARAPRKVDIFKTFIITTRRCSHCFEKTLTEQEKE